MDPENVFQDPIGPDHFLNIEIPDSLMPKISQTWQRGERPDPVYFMDPTNLIIKITTKNTVLLLKMFIM